MNAFLEYFSKNYKKFKKKSWQKLKIEKLNNKFKKNLKMFPFKKKGKPSRLQWKILKCRDIKKKIKKNQKSRIHIKKVAEYNMFKLILNDEQWYLD